MSIYGYAGKILWVDLNTETFREEPLDLEMAKVFIGGMGINARLVYDLIQPGIDPLSPDNPIIFGASLLGYTPVPGTSKIMTTTKFQRALSRGVGA